MFCHLLWFAAPLQALPKDELQAHAILQASNTKFPGYQPLVLLTDVDTDTYIYWCVQGPSALGQPVKALVSGKHYKATLMVRDVMYQTSPASAMNRSTGFGETGVTLNGI